MQHPAPVVLVVLLHVPGAALTAPRFVARTGVLVTDVRPQDVQHGGAPAGTHSRCDDRGQVDGGIVNAWRSHRRQRAQVTHERRAVLPIHRVPGHRGRQRPPGRIDAVAQRAQQGRLRVGGPRSGAARPRRPHGRMSQGHRREQDGADDRRHPDRAFRRAPAAAPMAMDTRHVGAPDAQVALHDRGHGRAAGRDPLAVEPLAQRRHVSRRHGLPEAADRAGGPGKRRGQDWTQETRSLPGPHHNRGTVPSPREARSSASALDRPSSASHEEPRVRRR